MKNIPEVLRKYTGRNPRIEDPVQRAGFELSMVGTNAYYKKGTFDWHQKANQIVLNEQTADFIYNDFTPLKIDYVRESRPFLERTVARLCAGREPSLLGVEGGRPSHLGKADNRGKVLAILDYVYRGRYDENVDVFPGRHLYVLNALEEEIPKVGHVSCECNSRLIICLAQIAGFPARFVSSYAYVDPGNGYAVDGGHAMVEIFLEGRWSLFDSDHGFFCVKKDGAIASLWDLVQDLSLVERQPGRVYNAFGHNRDWHFSFRKTFLSPYSVKSFSNYSANDYLHYDWRWIYCSDDPDDKTAVQVRKAREMLKKKLLHELL